MNKVFQDLFRNKRVLVTGHTGFKGSWLSTWLIELGAKVTGYSLDLPSEPSNFQILKLRERLEDNRGDVINFSKLKSIFKEAAPEIVFHLAAQAITRRSYDMPAETFSTNVSGTINVLECIRNSRSVKAAVIVTSDKCYQNFELARGYREDDRLGGDDPYSASKACAEIAFNSYIKSFFSGNASQKICSVRAGNVIGGGDWAIDRIVPDCIRALSENRSIVVRNPASTRPWQHVLEPISGYLWLGGNLMKNNSKVSGSSFNLGPNRSMDRTVEELANELIKVWGKGNWYALKDIRTQKKESALLKLNCDKVSKQLGWRKALSFRETVRMTAEWYKSFYCSKNDMYEFSVDQIEKYIQLAKKQNIKWAR